MHADLHDRPAATIADETSPNWRHSVQRLTRRFQRRAGTGEPAPPPASARLPHMAEVADFLRERGLPALPEHYAAAWIALGGPAPQPPTALPTAGELCANALDRLIVDAQGTLDGMSIVLTRSQADAFAFGSALETEAAALPPAAGTLDTLMTLTRTMIDRTNEADRRIRDMGNEMATLRGHLSEARTVATRDPLTALDNRRAIEALLDTAIATVAAVPPDGDDGLVVAYCDIDHFKAINDRLGHEVGDRVLKLVARILEDGVGEGGRAGRYGGEEFLLLFDGVSVPEAEERVDAVRRELAARTLRVRDTGEPIGTVTFSAGLCAWADGDDRETLLRRADRALYRAKAMGRNRIERG